VAEAYWEELGWKVKADEAWFLEGVVAEGCGGCRGRQGRRLL
jgi:hypothetical protein